MKPVWTFEKNLKGDELYADDSYYSIFWKTLPRILAYTSPMHAQRFTGYNQITMYSPLYLADFSISVSHLIKVKNG